MDQTGVIHEDSGASSTLVPFAKRAATLSFWRPFVTCIVFTALIFVAQLASGDIVFQIRQIVLGISCLAVIAGFGLGCIGLFGIRRHGKRGLLWHALVGTILNGLLAVAGCAGVYAVIEIKRESRSAASQDESRFMATLEQIQNGRRLLYEVARNETGDTARAAEALLKIMKKEEILMSSYFERMKPLMTVQVLDTSGVGTIDALQERRKLVQQFLEANNRLCTFCQNIETDYRTELQDREVSPAMIEKQLKAVRMRPEAGQPLTGIWKANVEWSELELKALDLLEIHWGDWRYDASLKQTIFTDQSLIEEYNKLVSEINRVDRERKQLKNDLHALGF
jgi:hypothetical protein